MLEPQIVPYFVGRKQVKIVAACRARSLAITTENQVYEWGFNADGDEQFNVIHAELPEEMVDVKMGLQFNMFLTKDGEVYASGIISQEG